MTRIALIAVCLAFAGCATAPVEQPAATTSFPPLSLDEFPGAAKLLTGFDDRTEEVDWVAHDRALFALRLDDGGDVKRWLLYLDARADVLVSSREPGSSVANPDGSALVLMRSLNADVVVTVLRADGEPLHETRVMLPASYLSQGLLPSIRTPVAQQPRGDIQRVLEAFRLQWQGLFTMSALLNVVRKNGVLADYFWQVVDVPSVWSVIAHLGAAPSVSVSFEKSVPVDLVDALPPVAASYSVPVQVDVNGSPALFVDLLACDAKRPYAICGGIVAAVARRPTHPDTTFRMQLLAARCGSVARDTTGTAPPTR